MNPSNLTMYGCLICPYVQRARTALIELAIPFTYEEVDLLRNEQFSEWYKAINAISKVPALILPDKRIICESLVIVDYLNDVYGKVGGKNLYPEDPVEKARLRQWVSYLDSSIIPKMFPIYGAIKEDSKEKILAGIKDVQEGIKFLIKHSGFIQRKEQEEKSSGSKDIYFWGSQFTYFDVATLPFIQNFQLLIKDYYPDIDIFKAVVQTDAENLEIFKNYFNFASQRNSFQQATNKVDSLPEISKSQTLTELKVDSVAQWSYAEFHQKFMEVRLRPVGVVVGDKK